MDNDSMDAQTDCGKFQFETNSIHACRPLTGAGPFTEDGLALQFAEQHAHDLRFVASWSKWLIWTGTHWRPDDTLLAVHLVRKVCREAAAKCGDPRAANALASAKAVSAVERLARADRRLAAAPEQWDRDPWLLNTPGGLVDLRTQETRQARPTDYVTKITAVAPCGSCPRWHQFLDRITDGDRGLQDFLQRMCGYALTGSTEEQALFFLFGKGANGKSVFINAVAGILGSYHKTAAVETFVATTTDQHPTGLAGLQGARLVTAIETEEGRPWAESRIKSLTGGDRITARRMRQDWFEYDPQFKLLIGGNHMPSLRSVDEAISRRFNLLPFTVTIPPRERDGRLPEVLKAEWSGILAWMIEGCLRWQQNGLRPSAAILEATQAYLAAEDTVAHWIDEACVQDAGAITALSTLFTSWKMWAEQNGEPPGSPKKLSQNLEARRFERCRTRNGSSFRGLRIRDIAHSNKAELEASHLID
ncbi:phage/plasmid primase P4 [Microvirga aerophila]|uniref:Phage/plasmid primase P4 n=2 Tax=Microvirga aerophila TaxID=670291 RepID=A0A512BNS7_9HYPH|nr:phage/plasmid primase P4 [Microvirga aerophila]